MQNISEKKDKKILGEYEERVGNKDSLLLSFFSLRKGNEYTKSNIPLKIYKSIVMILNTQVKNNGCVKSILSVRLRHLPSTCASFKKRDFIDVLE